MSIPGIGSFVEKYSAREAEIAALREELRLLREEPGSLYDMLHEVLHRCHKAEQEVQNLKNWQAAFKERYEEKHEALLAAGAENKKLLEEIEENEKIHNYILDEADYEMDRLRRKSVALESKLRKLERMMEAGK